MRIYNDMLRIICTPHNAIIFSQGHKVHLFQGWQFEDLMWEDTLRLYDKGIVFKKAFKIVFLGEPAVDLGGPK